MTQDFDPHIMGKLDNFTWMNFNPIPFLEDNDITLPLQKGIIRSG